MIQFRTPFIVLLAVIPMMAACGSSSSSPSTNSAPAQPTADPANLVLHLPDVGLGYITVAADTKKIPLAQEMKGESPTAKAAERASYQGGYSALFANSSKGGVLSEALEYSNESAATTVGNDHMAVKQFTKSLHGHPIAVPSNAPGTNGLLVAGQVSQNGHAVPAFAFKWQHGSVIAVLLVFDHHATAKHLIDLANHQDSRISGTGL